MTSPAEHLRLYGFLRKELLSRYFALGIERRNDFYQESTTLLGAPTRVDLLAMSPEERQRSLWRKSAARDNPWLFGCKLTVALATEARLGVPGAEPLLGRIIRSGEQLFKFSGSFRGLPVRWDPVTSDDWSVMAAGEPRLPNQFLLKADGRDYVFSMSPGDARHFPYLSRRTGDRLMGPRLFARYQAARQPGGDGGYVARYRYWECSQDELVGVVTTYVAVAEGTGDAALRRVARLRLRRVAEYLATCGYLMVLPGGGLAARGPGDALPAMEWPFTRAISRAADIDLSGLPTATFAEALALAGVWELFRGPTDRAMAAAWALGLTVGAPLLSLVETLLAAWSAGSWSPKLLTPGEIGFVLGINDARGGFDVSNDAAQGGMAIAALLHSWVPRTRFLNYSELVGSFTGAGGPFSTGFMPYLGFIAAGDDDRTTANAYSRWLATRRARGVDTDDYSATCFASAVGLLLSVTRNVDGERELVNRLNARHDLMAEFGEAAVVEPADITHAVDYLAGLALAWRYRQEREAAGDQIDTADFPEPPAAGVAWPEPGVPRSVVESMPDWVPVRAIQGRVPPTYGAGDEAPLFAPGSPSRPPVTRPRLAVAARPPVIYDETFLVVPGPELFTGLVLQWGDTWSVTAGGELEVDGGTIGPRGTAAPVWDTDYPVHGGRDSRATSHGLVARLNNYVLVGRRRATERWLYPDEAFLYLRLNQPHPSGTGGFTARVRVRGARRPLKRLLEVSCIQRRSGTGPDSRLRAIGGVHRDGSRWTFTIDEAVAAAQAGVVFFVREPGRGAHELVVVNRRPRPYLRARADATRTNDLASLPACPAP
jgi:hypothetical protein